MPLQKKTKGKIKVFFIDDDESFLFVLKRHLERKNIFEIHSFTSGEAGIEQLHINPEILILDYKLNRSGSRMNGQQVVEVVKQQLKKIKIIMLSGQKDGHLVLELIRMGIKEYLVKSADSLEELDYLLDFYLSERK